MFSSACALCNKMELLLFFFEEAYSRYMVFFFLFGKVRVIKRSIPREKSGKGQSCSHGNVPRVIAVHYGHDGAKKKAAVPLAGPVLVSSPGFPRI